MGKDKIKLRKPSASRTLGELTLATALVLGGFNVLKDSTTEVREGYQKYLKNQNIPVAQATHENYNRFLTTSDYTASQNRTNFEIWYGALLASLGASYAGIRFSQILPKATGADERGL